MLGYEINFSTNASMADTVQLGDSTVWGPLAPGEVKEIRPGLNLPVTESGRYYLSIVVDPDNQVAETNEINNMAVISLDVQIQQPDVAILPGLTQTNFTGAQNPHMELVFSTTNSGPLNIHDCYTGVYFSDDPVLDGSDRLLAVAYEFLASQGYMTQTNQLRLPVTESGRYYLIEKADPHDFLKESDEINNLQVVTVEVTVLRPDLEPGGLQVPGTYTGPDGGSFSISYTVTNRGPALAMDRLEWYDTIYLSTNGLLDAKSFILSSTSRSAPLNGFSAVSVTNSVIMPAGVNGDARIFVRVNAVESVLELSTNNNVISSPLQIAITQPDLLPFAVSVPAVVNGGPFPNVNIVWGITNAGPGAALASFYKQIYFSTDATLEPESDLYVDSRWDDMPLNSAASRLYEQSISVRLTNSVSGYLLFVSDAFDRISEINEANNIVAVPIRFVITWPDLVALPIIFPNQLTTSPEPRALAAWGISNAGPGRVDATWPPIASTLHLSRNDQYDDWDSQLVSRSFNSVLPAGGVAWFTNEVRLYITNSGNWHLVARVDTDKSFLEVSELNNTSSLPFNLTVNYPDVVAGPLMVPANLVYTPNSQISVTLAATNFGLGTMRDTGLSHTLWISSKPVIDEAAIHLRSVGIDKQLGTGEGYAEQVSVDLPITNSGTYYLISEAGRLLPWDSNLTNNVTVQILNVQVAPADLQPVILQVSVPPTELPKPVVQFVAGVTNHGPGAAYAAGTRRDSLVLSRDGVLDSSDEVLASHHLAGQQPAHNMLWFTNKVTLPITTSGTYYLFWVADDWQSVPEADESNNAFMTALNITVTPPDLAPLQFSIPQQISGPPYPWVEIICAITNYGPGAAHGEFWGHAIYSADAPDGKWNISEPCDLLPGQVSWLTNRVRLPMTNSGTFDVVYEVNASRDMVEADYSNNTITNHVVYTAQLPDLAPVNISVPSVWTIPENQRILISYGITNAGEGWAMSGGLTTGGRWTDAMYFSFDQVLSGDDISIFEVPRERIMEPHSSYWASETVQVPNVSGSYYLLLVANAYNYFLESSFTNNVLAVPITIRERHPDLVPKLLIAPGIITNPVSQVTFCWYVANEGLGSVRADATWSDQIALSDTPDIYRFTHPVSSVMKSGTLPPGLGYWITNSVWLATGNDGDYFFVLRTAGNTYLTEESTTNNAIVVPVQLRLNKPDLAIIDVQTPSSIQAYPGVPIEIRWGITNAGTGPTRPDSSVDVTIGYKAGSDYNEPLLEVTCPALPPGGSAHFTNTFKLPSGITNKLELVIEADSNWEQYESTRTNNQVRRSIPLALLYPDLEVSVITYPTNLAFSLNQTVQFVYAVTNIGTGTAEIDHCDSVTISNSLGDTLGPISNCSHSNSLAPGEGFWATNVVTMPFSIRVGPALAYLRVNSDRIPSELNWENNTLVLPMQLEHRLPDLALSLSILQTNLMGCNSSALVRWALTNLGPGDFYPSTEDQLSLGVSDEPDGWFQNLFELSLTNRIPAGTGMQGTNMISLSQFTRGVWHVVVDADTWGELAYTNNTASAPLVIDLGADLAVTAFMAPSVLSGAANQQVTLITEVANRGTGQAWPGWYYRIRLLSPYSGFYDGLWAVFYAEHCTALCPGESRWFTNTVSIPNMPQGSYRWRADIESAGYSDDLNRANNQRDLPVQVSLSRPSQLRAISLTADAKATLTAPLAEIRWSVVNEGDGPAGHNWFDSVYYSLDSQLSLDDTLVCTRTNLTGLGSGANYSWQTFITLPSDATSGAFLILSVDRNQALWDEAPGNNTLSTTLRIAPFGSGPTWLTEPRFVNGRFQASLHGVAGQSVVLQASTNLVDWESLRALTFQTEELDIEDTNSGGSAPRFYRLIPWSEVE
jgi:subtilase family serine protease